MKKELCELCMSLEHGGDCFNCSQETARENRKRDARQKAAQLPKELEEREGLVATTIGTNRKAINKLIRWAKARE